MKRSKNQAVYKFLPETWVSERNESNVAVTAKIIKWNYDKMQDIYDDFIENEIKRQIEYLENVAVILHLLIFAMMFIHSVS